ncbi:MAG TPA: DNA polymerase III subunit delta' [Sedimenticola sp.]|nr:DNA polymerase III subunit delta' [Sedimenticola sp.]
MSMPGEAKLLPWHRDIWSRLQAARGAGRLPHALLLAGAGGLGKRQFADAFAHSLFCASPDESGAPCGHCRGCHLFQVGNHPDFICIEPEEAGKAIKIDVIRGLVDKGALTTQAGGYRVIVIEPADAMNTAAANSLLKTLEEPVPWTLMILVTSRPGRLPATIRSRCQRVTFPIPPRHQAMEWLGGQIGQGDPQLLLALASGAPLQARALAQAEILKERALMADEFYAAFKGEQDPVAIAGRWEKLDLPRVLNWMAGWLIDMLRLKSGAQPPVLYNPDQRPRLQSMAQGLDFKVLHGMLDRVYDANRTLGSQLNTLMLLESLLLAWANSKTASGVRENT